MTSPNESELKARIRRLYDAAFTPLFDVCRLRQEDRDNLYIALEKGLLIESNKYARQAETALLERLIEQKEEYKPAWFDENLHTSTPYIRVSILESELAKRKGM